MCVFRDYESSLLCKSAVICFVNAKVCLMLHVLKIEMFLYLIVTGIQANQLLKRVLKLLLFVNNFRKFCIRH